MKYLLRICFILLLSSAAYSQAFVDKGYNAKITSLGKAATALTNDAALIYYNPAAIGFETSSNIFTNFSNLYPDVIDENMNVISAGGVYAFEGIGVVGLGVTQFAPKLWSERTITGSFATRMFSENLSLGLNAKLLMWSAEAPRGENAVPEPALSFNGITFDLGATYQFKEIAEENDLNVGVSIMNFTQPSVASNGSSDAALPMDLNFGAAFISHKYHYTILNTVTVVDGDVKISAGTEILAMETSVVGLKSEFTVRLGGGRVMAKDSQGDYNGGFGLKLGDFTLDYSYSYQAFIQHVGGISSISIGYHF